VFCMETHSDTIKYMNLITENNFFLQVALLCTQ
jgi:hypothetical protein